ncbi:MAG: UDP-N-acetylmuramoyl-tripeptide--D-alanyl-D-alanine ligase [Candidatus Doudnabacteria bacterium]
MKKTFQKILLKYSKTILHKYKPEIVAVTGSVGKTSAKEAIFSVLRAKYPKQGIVRKNNKNYNNEFGLSFTIIGVDSPKRNPFKWIFVFLKAFILSRFFSHYPKVLILELGIDRPGDMDVLTEIIKPHIAVLTTIGVSHLQNFKNENQIFEEKRKIFKHLSVNDYAILNQDDAKVRTAVSGLKSKVLTYGFDSSSDLWIDGYNPIYEKGGIYGSSFTLKYLGEKEDIFLPNTIGIQHVSAAVAAAAVGIAQGMDLSQISAALRYYKPEPGRMGILPGEYGTVILDDTYNAAPLSMHAALRELASFPASHKVAVLGDMLELGPESEQAHINIANEIKELQLDSVILVGPEMHLAYEHLKKSGFNETTQWFKSSVLAIQASRKLLAGNTVMLIKGSRGMHMDRVVREVMRDKEHAERLLV